MSDDGWNNPKLLGDVLSISGWGSGQIAPRLSKIVNEFAGLAAPFIASLLLLFAWSPGSHPPIILPFVNLALLSGQCDLIDQSIASSDEIICLLPCVKLNSPSIVRMKQNSNWRVFNLALTIIVLDQATKLLVLKYLKFATEREVIPGFFKFVHWGNTGAAWSMFSGNNGVLAMVAAFALVVLFLTRHHFNIHTLGGQISLGLIFGGIVGNLIDRLRVGHVVDFIYFYVERRDGQIAGFPAFNVADSAICIGVGLLFVLSWRNGNETVSASDARGR